MDRKDSEVPNLGIFAQMLHLCRTGEGKGSGIMIDYLYLDFEPYTLWFLLFLFVTLFEL